MKMRIGKLSSVNKVQRISTRTINNEALGRPLTRAVSGVFKPLQDRGVGSRATDVSGHRSDSSVKSLEAAAAFNPRWADHVATCGRSLWVQVSRRRWIIR